MLRILFVSYFYPPFSSIGGLRVSKMTRYLLEAGHDVRVLTVARDDVPADLPLEIPGELVLRTGLLDVNALPKAVLGEQRIHRRGYEVSPSSLLAALGGIYRNVTNFPDGQIGWLPHAYAAGRRLLAHWSPDVVVSSALPGTAHLVGRLLASPHRIPWVAEYRDPWSESARHRWKPFALLERRLEDATTRRASSIITVSDSWAERYRKRFPHIPVYVVPNGFDPADYASPAPSPRSGPLRLVYTGRLYDRQDLKPLFEAVRGLLSRRVISAEDLRVRFIGRYLGSVERQLAEIGLDRRLIEISGPIPYLEALREQQRAHALLLVLASDDDVGWRPAKLYEYVGAGRPILVIGGTPQHEARQIVLRLKAGVCAVGADDIARQLAKWVAAMRTGGTLMNLVEESDRAEFERSRLAGEYGEVLNEVVRRCRSARS